MHRNDGAKARRAGWLFLPPVLFIAAAVAVHVLRDDHDGWHAPLSFYLSGPYGHWLVAAYCVLGVGLVALALAARAATVHEARYALTPVLFAGGAVSLAVTAFWPGSAPGHPADPLGDFIHRLSAMCSFLLVGFGMLLQSLGLRRDPAWRRAAGPLLALAVAAFAALWAHALWRGLPRGASQKAVVALYLLWAAWLAWRLRALSPRPTA